METFGNSLKINQFESKVFELTNQIRRKYGLNLLKWDFQLIEASQNHSRDMDKNKMKMKISHTGSDNSTLRVRVEKTGYRGFFALGENVAWGQQTPKKVLESWMNSPGHRKNILNPNYKEIGVGYVNGYWTQIFGYKS